LSLALGSTPAAAFTFFDGKLEVHGFAAEQIRGLAKNLNPDQEFDLAQWYNVFDLELEAKPFPNGIGPLEIVEFYARFEARYDCIWTHGCGMFPSVDTYGNRADHLPPRLIDGRYRGFAGQLTNGDRRYFTQVNRDTFRLENRNDPLRNDQEPLRMQELPGFVNLFGYGFGPNQVFDPIHPTTGDDGPPFVFSSIIQRCKFAGRNVRGGENGHVTDILGPWNPSCPVTENGALRLKPNPFSTLDINPRLWGVDGKPNTGDEPIDPLVTARNNGDPTAVQPFGRGELPFRPAPFHSDSERGLGLDEAQGIYVPSAGLRREIKDGKLDGIDQNFGQQELAWNHGESQQDEKELKEAYVDIEALEGRLWMRIGKQTIVWGKTELFRNTDQFNPQDFALASLPGLEESRIALWSARGTYSFYNWGKVEDIRLELAFNFDDSQPADLGRCGEPFAFEAVCNLTFGYFAHGISGAGLAGRDKPPAPWEDISGLESGARLEWRYKRFSFQLSDFYGYDDFPFVRRITTYERNVDETTGRPRRAGNHGACLTGAEPACLGRPGGVLLGSDGQPVRLVDTANADGVYDGIPDTPIQRNSAPDPNLVWLTGSLIIDPALKADVLQYQSANQTAFALGSIGCGATNADPALCGLAALNGHGGPGGVLGTPIAAGASAIIAGSAQAVNSGVMSGFLCTLRNNPQAQRQACRVAFSGALRLINRDPGDDVGVFSDGGGSPFTFGQGTALGQRLSPQQEALWGCGPFFQSDCDIDGVDLMNAEASMVLQSWPGFEGTRGSVFDWDTRRPGQPGTMGFHGGPVATRFVNGRTVILPGARGPTDAGYNPRVDGCVGPGPFGCNTGDNGRTTAANLLTNPFSGEQFKNELAATSWNYLMTLVAGGRELQNPNLATISEFDPFDPYGIGIRPPGSPNAGVPRMGINVQAAEAGQPTSCGFFLPLLCQNTESFLAGTGVRRNSVKAGGTNEFGRRDFAWHSSGELVLDYQKRNVLGFAFDFDEDRTKSNWGVEASWVNKQPFSDNDEFSGVSKVDTLNLTISIDRPTFINFLNPGRTFFFNTQFFLQYINDYHNGFWANGPLNALATLTVFTGYFQDRLMFYNTFVYDVNSSSGALLPSVSYRFTENFSVTAGSNVFFGHQELRDSPINEIRPLNRVGNDAYKDAVENGLAALRERDEVYLQLRYTF
jgi:hypothetical protein